MTKPSTSAPALLSFASADLIGGNGFIAAFVAGMTLGNSQRGKCESLLFAILILEEADLPHGQLVFNVVILTVLGSVFAHGMSAAPGATWYGKLARDASRCPAEHKAVVEHPLAYGNHDSRE